METSGRQHQDGGVRMTASGWWSQDNGIRMEMSGWQCQDGDNQDEGVRTLASECSVVTAASGWCIGQLPWDSSIRKAA